MPQAPRLIQTYTVPTNANSFSFNTVPQTYTDLVIYYQAKMIAGGTGWYDFLITFNGSTSGYSGNTNYSDGANPTTPTKLSITEGTTGVTQRASTNTSPNTEYTYSLCKFYIPNYTTGLRKVVLNDHITEQYNTVANGGTAGLFANATRWENTAAITTITCTGITGNSIAAGSSFSLYGIS
jgi:hypothetical protein